MKMIITKGFIFFIGLFFLLSCSGKKAVELDVQMFSGPEFEAMLVTSNYWNENYSKDTGITVNVTDQKRGYYFEKIETQLISGLATPDIIHPFSINLGKLKNHLEPLNEYLSDNEIMQAPNGKKLSIDVMLKAALRTTTAEDNIIYMIPIDMSTVNLFYRKDLISTPPDTWEEFVDVSKNFTKSINPSSPTDFGAIIHGKYERGTILATLETIWPYGGSFLESGTSIPNFDNQGTVDAFKIIEDLARSGAFPPNTVNADYMVIAEALQSGNVAMGIQWNAFYNTLFSETESPLVFNKFEIAPPPGVLQEDGTIRRDMYVHTISLGINKNSENKEAAIKFIVWATLGEGALIYAAAGGASPIKPIWESEESAMPFPVLVKWVEDFGRPIAVHEKMSELMLIASGWIQKLIAGEVSAKEASVELNKEIKEYLENNLN